MYFLYPIFLFRTVYLVGHIYSIPLEQHLIQNRIYLYRALGWTFLIESENNNTIGLEFKTREKIFQLLYNIVAKNGR